MRFSWIALSFWLLTQCFPAGAQPLPPAVELLSDARILRESLEHIHPGLYRYNTPEQFATHYAAFEKEFTTASDLSHAYVALARFLSVIQCGHTFPNAANQSKAVTEALMANRPRAPFFFRWIDRKMMVTRAKDFPAGTEILAINGVKAPAILAKLMPLSRTDGANETKRIANLDLLPDKRWQAFDVLYPLVFSSAKEWTFDVREPGRRRRTVRLAATREDVKRGDWQFAIDGDVATLTMQSWVTYNDKWDWEGFLQRSFDEMKARNVRNLIVDIRGNEGGTSVGNVILAHLVTRDLPLDLFHRFTRYRTVSPALRPYLDTWDRSFDDWGDAAKPSATRPGFYELSRKEQVISRSRRISTDAWSCSSVPRIHPRPSSLRTRSASIASAPWLGNRQAAIVAASTAARSIFSACRTRSSKRTCR